jgi:hypothetical protein
MLYDTTAETFGIAVESRLPRPFSKRTPASVPRGFNAETDAMFDDDGLWPCKCSECEHEWYSSIAAMRAEAVVICPTCGAPNFIPIVEFDRALNAARTGSYDFSYLARIPAQFRFGTSAPREDRAPPDWLYRE